MPRIASQGDAAVLVWTSPEVRGGMVRGVLLREGTGDSPAKLVTP
jgi:hypothetical protein